MLQPEATPARLTSDNIWRLRRIVSHPALRFSKMSFCIRGQGMPGVLAAASIPKVIWPVGPVQSRAHRVGEANIPVLRQKMHSTPTVRECIQNTNV